MGEYEVEDFSIGDKVEGDKIVFKSVDDMENAHKDIGNGNDIYIVKDGLVTKLLHQMISTKVYDGTISLMARKSKKQGGQ